MILKLVLLVFAVAVCTAKKSAPPAPAPTPAPLQPAAPQVFCGEPPDDLLSCIAGNLQVINPEATKNCKGRRLSECDSMKCIFRESGWALAGDRVNKANVTAHFTEYAAAHPEWTLAVNDLKQNCLGPVDLPAQGATLNCAALDVIHCIFTSFIKKATPGQWQGSAKCTYPRSYAAACPYCPSSCFAAAIPVGSCNACYLPKTP